jgi:hypothetical protein
VVTNQAAVLDAAGEPTKLAIIEPCLAERCRSAGSPDRLPVSRPPVSQHLKEVGRVADHASGTRRLQLDPTGVAAVRAWVDGAWTPGGALSAAAEQLPEQEP